MMLYKSEQGPHMIGDGKFDVRPIMPGALVPGHGDHGYGPLALIAESFMAPDTLIPMHEHVQDEIISYVPQGAMRHDDRTNGKLVTDRDHLMVMNAGRSFWHEERTLDTDLPLRMLQIFVRPYAIDLEPQIQHGPIAAVPAGEWRYLVGPQDGGGVFFVRNAIRLLDVRLEAGMTTQLPSRLGWDTFFYVFTGAIDMRGETFREGESGLAIAEPDLILTAAEPSLIVAFSIDPAATVTRMGTVGDHRSRKLAFERGEGTPTGRLVA